MKVPCKDCPRRDAECHAKCPEYVEYAAERENARGQRAEERKVRDVDYEMIYRRMKKLKRR